MNFMRAFAAVLVALFVAAAPAHAKPQPKRANLAQLARNLVRAGAPGAIVYLRTPTGTRAGVAGYADRDAHVSMRAADRYRIASLTKAFVSVLVLQLEAEAKLDIDDAVETWRPGVVPNGGAISLRRLMNHTSGLFDYTADETFGKQLLAAPGRTWTPQELLALGFAHAPLFAPGTNWTYSNTNYVVLGLLVEKLTGKPLAQALQERIFTPLNLASTSFPSTITLEPDFVHGYFQSNDVTPLLGPTWAWAAGGIVSNARDVTTFYRALLTGRLIPSAQLRELERPADVAGVYGLGIETSVTTCGRTYGHAGDFLAWRNIVIATANGKRQAVVMVNADETTVAWARLGTLVQTALCRG
ncbi:MAG: serine hydrolase domain-containing protein [Gaiellaceae bacterium]